MLGPNASLSESIDSLQKRNQKLERMIVKIGTAQDDFAFRDKSADEISWIAI